MMIRANSGSPPTAPDLAEVVPGSSGQHDGVLLGASFFNPHDICYMAIMTKTRRRASRTWTTSRRFLTDAGSTSRQAGD